jgi:hypothetical protein
LRGLDSADVVPDGRERIKPSASELRERHTTCDRQAAVFDLLEISFRPRSSRSGRSDQRFRGVPAAVRKKCKTAEAQYHHRPSRWLRDSRRRGRGIYEGSVVDVKVEHIAAGACPSATELFLGRRRQGINHLELVLAVRQVGGAEEKWIATANSVSVWI